MKFIDLFSGLGGFHYGLSKSGNYECVYAAEIDPELRQLYADNYGITPDNDITKIAENEIPAHDIICAGFPCTSFSLAGKKSGTKCPRDGKLIDDVLRIAKYHNPDVVILENVPKVLTIEDGKFWKYIRYNFDKIGYKLKHKIISPTHFNIPQARPRLFIIGFRDKTIMDNFHWPEPNIKYTVRKLTSLLADKQKRIPLETPKQRQLKKWQALLNHVGRKAINSNSIMAPEFGASYPSNFKTLTLAKMRQYKGAYGVDLHDCTTWKEIMERMPAYTRNQRSVPKWMTPSLCYSRKLYKNHLKFLKKWAKDINKKNNSWQVLEWRGYPDNVDMTNHLIQFRASGIRVMKCEVAPSLTAMTPTQIPIIGSDMGYMTKHEAARLQHLHNLPMLPHGTTKAFKALGNAVNTKIVESIGKNIATALTRG
ncbi:MAG: DNA cytosine methyltransferase [Parvibaculales bacterium]